MLIENWLGLIIGISAICWFGHLQGWETAVALGLCLFADSLSQI